MASEEKKGEPFVAQRNFTLPTADKLRALAAGPPPFARRLRKIEDLTAALLQAIVEHEAAEGEIDGDALPELLRRRLEAVNRLIDDHNRYYPIEARLPIDVRTRRLMDWGEPWQPTPHLTAAEVVARARRG